ncbi:unnamed protein product [Pleuronectes platessa]|uniref:Uncharacterized protein n=1 Tax=Pleuronectes platessa TaxID=8262 RepID=A0A9N7VTG9_PLEPL|nr:unnamed protein product [Pleuronectes platessa]
MSPSPSWPSTVLPCPPTHSELLSHILLSLDCPSPSTCHDPTVVIHLPYGAYPSPPPPSRSLMRGPTHFYLTLTPPRVLSLYEDHTRMLPVVRGSRVASLLTRLPSPSNYPTGSREFECARGPRCHSCARAALGSADFRSVRTQALDARCCYSWPTPCPPLSCPALMLRRGVLPSSAQSASRFCHRRALGRVVRFFRPILDVTLGLSVSLAPLSGPAPRSARACISCPRLPSSCCCSFLLCASSAQWDGSRVSYQKYSLRPAHSPSHALHLHSACPLSCCTTPPSRQRLHMAGITSQTFVSHVPASRPPRSLFPSLLRTPCRDPRSHPRFFTLLHPWTTLIFLQRVVCVLTTQPCLAIRTALACAAPSIFILYHGHSICFTSGTLPHDHRRGFHLLHRFEPRHSARRQGFCPSCDSARSCLIGCTQRLGTYLQLEISHLLCRLLISAMCLRDSYVPEHNLALPAGSLEAERPA